MKQEEVKHLHIEAEAVKLLDYKNRKRKIVFESRLNQQKLLDHIQ